MKLHTLFLGHLISQKPRNPYHQTTTITVTVPVKTLPLECKVRAPVFGSTLAPGDWLGHYCREKVSVTQSCLTLCNLMDCSPPGSSVHGDSPGKILEWVATLSSRGSAKSRDQTQVSHIAGRFFPVWATREADHPFLLLRKWKHREAEPISQDHTAGTWVKVS